MEGMNPRASIFVVLALTAVGFAQTPSVPAPSRSLASPTVSPSDYTRTEDVVYGRKFGVALTLDVFQPKTGGNGLAIFGA